MDDFDLSQALEGPSDLDETGFKSSCFDDMDAQDEVIRIDEGLDLMVSRSKLTMTKVVSLVLAVNRWKTPLASLSDDELCSAVMESLVEETVVESAVTRQTNPSYTRTKSVECTLCDDRQKAVILNSGQLQAITLKGGYNDRKVNFRLGDYIPSNSRENESVIVVLSIKNSNWHISCSMEGDKAVLCLEECSKASLMQIRDESMRRFLFHKRANGISLSMLESVMCSGWVISTSPDKENQPLEMCEEKNTCRLTSFKLI